MNFIAAILLLTLEEEEDAFWVLCAIVEGLCPEYYTPSMLGIHTDLAVFQDLLAHFLPRLASHFARQGVETGWFLIDMLVCIFIHKLPMSSLLHVWDLMFVAGQAPCVFATALSFFKLHEQQLLATEGRQQLMEELRRAVVGWERECDEDALLHSLLHYALALDERHIARLRATHRAQYLQAQAEQEEQRRRLRAPSMCDGMTSEERDARYTSCARVCHSAQWVLAQLNTPSHARLWSEASLPCRAAAQAQCAQLLAAVEEVMAAAGSAASASVVLMDKSHPLFAPGASTAAVGTVVALDMGDAAAVTAAASLPATAATPAAATPPSASGDTRFSAYIDSAHGSGSGSGGGGGSGGGSGVDEEKLLRKLLAVTHDQAVLLSVEPPLPDPCPALLSSLSQSLWAALHSLPTVKYTLLLTRHLAPHLAQYEAQLQQSVTERQGAAAAAAVAASAAATPTGSEGAGGGSSGGRGGGGSDLSSSWSEVGADDVAHSGADGGRSGSSGNGSSGSGSGSGRVRKRDVLMRGFQFIASGGVDGGHSRSSSSGGTGAAGLSSRREDAAAAAAAERGQAEYRELYAHVLALLLLQKLQGENQAVGFHACLSLPHARMLQHSLRSLRLQLVNYIEKAGGVHCRSFWTLMDRALKEWCADPSNSLYFRAGLALNSPSNAHYALCANYHAFLRLWESQHLLSGVRASTVQEVTQILGACVDAQAQRVSTTEEVGAIMARLRGLGERRTLLLGPQTAVAAAAAAEAAKAEAAAAAAAATAAAAVAAVTAADEADQAAAEAAAGAATAPASEAPEAAPGASDSGSQPGGDSGGASQGKAEEVDGGEEGSAESGSSSSSGSGGGNQWVADKSALASLPAPPSAPPAPTGAENEEAASGDAAAAAAAAAAGADGGGGGSGGSGSQWVQCKDPADACIVVGDDQPPPPQAPPQGATGPPSAPQQQQWHAAAPPQPPPASATAAAGAGGGAVVVARPRPTLAFGDHEEVVVAAPYEQGGGATAAAATAAVTPTVAGAGAGAGLMKPGYAPAVGGGGGDSWIPIACPEQPSSSPIPLASEYRPAATVAAAATPAAAAVAAAVAPAVAGNGGGSAQGLYPTAGLSAVPASLPPAQVRLRHMQQLCADVTAVRERAARLPDPAWMVKLLSLILPLEQQVRGAVQVQQEQCGGASSGGAPTRP